MDGETMARETYYINSSYINTQCDAVVDRIGLKNCKKTEVMNTKLLLFMYNSTTDAPS